MTVTPQARHREDDGFLLLEALIVLLILALASSIAAPMFQRSRPGDDLRAKAVEVSALLKAARSAARKNSQMQSVDYSVVARRLTWSRGARAVTVPAPMSLSLSDAPSSLVDEQGGRGSESQSAIRFFPNGSSNGATIKIRSSGRTATVTTDWLSGETRLRVAN